MNINKNTPLSSTWIPPVRLLIESSSKRMWDMGLLFYRLLELLQHLVALRNPWFCLTCGFVSPISASFCMWTCWAVGAIITCTNPLAVLASRHLGYVFCVLSDSEIGKTEHSPPKARMLEACYPGRSQQLGFLLLVLLCVGRGTKKKECVLIQAFIFVLSIPQSGTPSCQQIYSGQTETSPCAALQNIFTIGQHVSFLFSFSGRSWEFLPHLLCSARPGGGTMESKGHNVSYQLQYGWFCAHLGCRSLLTVLCISHKGNCWVSVFKEGKEGLKFPILPSC